MRPLGLSAFIRCKNEEEYVVASITSVYRVFDEIVVVLNNSTDRTRELVEDLMIDRPKIRLLQYDAISAPWGPGYRKAIDDDPSRSVAKFYNWCIEQTTFSHVCKWDGDMIALPNFEQVRDLIASNEMVSFDGYDVLNLRTTSLEPRIFRYDASHTRYEDWDLYEVLMHDYEKAYVFAEKCFLHMKLVKKEWLHRQWTSLNDFATSAPPAPKTGTTGSQVPAGLGSILRRVLRRMFRT